MRGKNLLNGTQLARIENQKRRRRRRRQENAERKKKWRERERELADPRTRRNVSTYEEERGVKEVYYKRPRSPSFRNTVKPCIAWRKIICTCFNGTRNVRTRNMFVGRASAGARAALRKDSRTHGDVRF